MSLGYILAIPETTVKVKNSNARSADVTVEIQLAVSKSSLAIDGSNSVDKPNKEESQKKELVINVERSCRILIQMLAENQSVVGNQTLENLNMHTKSWEVTFSNLQPFSNYLVSVMQQCGGLDAGESHCPTQRTKANQISFRTMEERK